MRETSRRRTSSEPVPILSSAGPVPPSVLKRRALITKARRKGLPRFVGSYLALGFLSLVTLSGLQSGGHLTAWRMEHGSFADGLARFAGFGIERVTLSGHSQLTESEILHFAGITPKSSLALLDVEDVREKLEAVPLIKSASIRKLYPDGLAITLTEREAHALWQKDGELFIISQDGAVIDTMRDERFAKLPHVVGEGANLRTKEYLSLLDAAGPLRERIRAGTLVSGRRWTLKIDNGLDVRLPEEEPEAALKRLIALEKNQQILSRDVIAVDLRMKDRVAVRLTEEAAAARMETMRKKPSRGKGVDT